MNKLLGDDYEPAFPGKYAKRIYSDEDVDALRLPRAMAFVDADCRGMSLRDYFAGEALKAFSREWQVEQGHSYAGNCGIVAEKCYAMADAMLMERGK